jgi:hypothetical protein
MTSTQRVDQVSTDELQFEDRALGDWVSLFRTQQGLSRPKLVVEMIRIIDSEMPNYEGPHISESLIRTIEEKTRAHISRHLIELLCRALKCNPTQRYILFTAADLNPLVEPDGTRDAVADVILLLIGEIKQHPRGGALLKQLIGNKKVTKLTQQELFDVLEKVLILIKPR